jgi:2,4-dienoyl-CoA reductase-like NADH-dependent reductase (Old Yellow Enzyme family)
MGILQRFAIHRHVASQEMAIMEKTLFDKVQIGNITLDNRFVRSATWEGMCDPQGHVTQQLVAYYRGLAMGGTGLIITGYSYVRADGKQLPGKMGICDDEHLPGLTHLTEAVHQEGGVIFCQLVHAGGQTSSKVIGCQPLAPSAKGFASYQETPREMTSQDIREVVAAFGKAATRARQAGFDGVQLHGAHGYLINQFLSPLCNQRQDAYGGSLENRMLFLEEVMTAVRSAVGTDYPVTIKLTAADHLQGGLQPKQGAAIAHRLDQLGIDAIEVSSGTAASGAMSPVRQQIDSPEREAYNAELARMIKQVVDVPVMVVGGLRSPTVMQKVLWEGDADLFSLSRPLIREPGLPRLWQKDDGYTARCISCNGCFRPGLKGEGIYCVVDRIEAHNRAPRA